MSYYRISYYIQEAIAMGFEEEIARKDTPECYFKSLPQELEVKRDRIAGILKDAGLDPIVPQGGYFIMADVRDIVNKVNRHIIFNYSTDFFFQI